MSAAYDPRRIRKAKGSYKRSYDGPTVARGSEATLGFGERVLGVEVNGEARAYALHLLNSYHVANDVVGGESVLVVYCHICESGLAFLSQLDGGELTFDGYGHQHGRVLIRDRQTKTLWNQEGEGVEGVNAGLRLEPLPASHLRWSEWLQLYPDTTVMQSAVPDRPKIHKAPGNEARSGLQRPVRDESLLFGLRINNEARAYPFEALGKNSRVVNDVVGGVPVAIFWNAPGSSGNAFLRETDGRTMTFGTESDSPFLAVDDRGGRWDFAGRARGDQALRLTQLPVDRVHAYGWFAYHPESSTWAE